MSYRHLADFKPDWQERALCQGSDLEDFYVDDVAVEDGIPATETWPIIQAKDVCADCPVRVLCLEWTLRMEDETGYTRRYGILGGTTGLERELVAETPDRLEQLLSLFEFQRRRWNLGSLALRRSGDAVG